MPLEEKIETIKQNVKEVEKNRDVCREEVKNTNTFIAFLDTRISKILQKLEYLRKRKKMEEKFDSQELTDTEKQQFEQKIYEEKLANQHWWESILSFFSSVEAEKHQKLLDAYYKDFVTLKQKIQNLNKRINLNNSLIKIAGEEQDVLRRYREKNVEEGIQIALAKIEAKMKPASLHKDIAKNFPNLELPASLTGKELNEYAPKAASEVFRLWVTLLANKAWKRSIENDLSKLGIETEIARYIENIGQIESQKRQIQPEIDDLMGHSVADFHKLNEIEKPKDKDRFLRGEIQHTRNLKIKALMNSAFISILNLILIPVIAFFLIRFMNKAGENLIAKAVGVTYKRRRVREQRISTLTGILKTISISVIVIIAGIYMLKQFRIDITPIIASAGILGLALAFGAQTLVRDYFSGFFILLENQYATGDLVEIAGIVGYVYRVTLRLTVVQAIDGTMHFFPNGTVSHVSNKSKDSRAVINVGVSYGENVDNILEILKEVAEDMKQDPKVGKMVLDEYEISGLNSFDDSAITYRMWIKTTPGDQWTVKRATQRRIKIYFDKYGVEIPFPQRVLHSVTARQPQEAEQSKTEAEERFLQEKEKLVPMNKVKEVQSKRMAIKENLEITSEEEAKKAEEVIDQIVDSDSSDNIEEKKKRKKRKKKKKK